jgi:hypothetical protein
VELWWNDGTGRNSGRSRRRVCFSAGSFAMSLTCRYCPLRNRCVTAAAA